ncbi:hypothetical protein RhiirC2_774364 [Rhizophagus irregularis]|uniref:Uncharacterized protein n=1 Tax=Rhizophagus irregularis TaxID=588596 RepID=A0A2N1NLE4_9GLOM|nr:hypothetical protein RhiirC2_774364 [Rhizophagus irregularis]
MRNTLCHNQFEFKWNVLINEHPEYIQSSQHAEVSNKIIKEKLNQTSRISEVVEEVQAIFNKQSKKAVLTEFMNKIPTRGLPSIMEKYFLGLDTVLKEYFTHEELVEVVETTGGELIDKDVKTEGKGKISGVVSEENGNFVFRQDVLIIPLLSSLFSCSFGTAYTVILSFHDACITKFSDFTPLSYNLLLKFFALDCWDFTTPLPSCLWLTRRLFPAKLVQLLCTQLAKKKIFEVLTSLLSNFYEQLYWDIWMPRNVFFHLWLDSQNSNLENCHSSPLSHSPLSPLTTFGSSWQQSLRIPAL